ncbi:uncharacterized protein N7511_011343 [Penicillium nucicola]|uniref:uncharacterized protein n=1 Tax=Penicillium nucicola TaxID=1850975 RepID=UPI00254507C2|nr:uncharacterized protein N7511_011343 [Penicillium nucicola]KAJ5742611.1 hypothetical protein N7511_011343 [Penicillium nucicola]
MLHRTLQPSPGFLINRQSIFNPVGWLHEPSAAQPGGYNEKQVHVTILPKEQTFFSAHPIIAAQEGNFSGNLAGLICYSRRCNDTYDIPGPRENQELNLSHVESGCSDNPRDKIIRGDHLSCSRERTIDFASAGRLPRKRIYEASKSKY